MRGHPRDERRGGIRSDVREVHQCDPSDLSERLLGSKLGGQLVVTTEDKTEESP
jgi:hypothetical protein